MTLVGPVPRLEEWLEQFYQARSSAVHEGRPHQLIFMVQSPKKEQLPHRALIMYGRRIFRTCLVTVLTGVAVTEESRIASLLVHNGERLRDICKSLSRPQTAAASRLLSVQRQVEELHECETLSMSFQLEEGYESLMGATRLVLAAYRECKQLSDVEIDRLLSQATSSGSDNSARATYESLTKLTETLRAKVREQRLGSEVDAIALRFLEFACRPAVGLAAHSHAIQNPPAKTGQS